jgi:DUF177 domain-containing protein
MTSFSLRQVKLRPGEQFRDEVEVQLEPFELGGQRYVPVPEEVPAELEITRATTGTVFSLAFHARMHGPCQRCLDDAVLDLDIRGREYQAESPDDDEQLRTEYLAGDNLELSDWARDLMGLALPDKILSHADEAEPAAFVQRDRGRVAVQDPGLDRPEAGLIGAAAELFEQRVPDAPSACRGIDVNRVLDDAAIAVAARDRRKRGPADDVARVPRDQPPDRQMRRVPLLPRRHRLLERAEVEPPLVDPRDGGPVLGPHLLDRHREIVRVTSSASRKRRSCETTSRQPP